MKSGLHAKAAHLLPDFALRPNLIQLDSALALRALGRVSPRLCARVIAARFVTPSRLAPPNEAEALLRKAHRFPFESRGKTYMGYSWGDGPSVLLAHGWSGNCGQFHQIIPALVSSGYSVIALDAPAHGQSPGKETNADEYAAAILALAQRAGGVKAVIAHSFGAMASLLGMRRGLKPEKLILIAPSTKPEYFLEQLCDRFGIPPVVKRIAREEIPRRVKLRWEDISTQALSSSVSQPVLVLHDPGDREVPWSHASELVSALPRAKLEALPGCGHRRILESQESIARILEFLET